MEKAREKSPSPINQALENPDEIIETGLLADCRQLINEAKQADAVAVNIHLTQMYWRIGERIPLVPKLQLGSSMSEAPASQHGKPELPALHSQAGAWERTTGV